MREGLKETVERPDLYTYLDYRSFLKDWFEYLRKTLGSFSMNQLAKKSGIASSLLPMILRGSRKLSKRNFEKLAPHMELNSFESNYLGLLRDLDEAKDVKERIEILKKMNRSFTFKKNNPLETEAYEYYSKWYYVAIREMADFPDFQLDPKWIRSRLKTKVPTKEIENALRFLLEKGYIKIKPQGGFSLGKVDPQCDTGVQRIALSEFHRTYLQMAAESIFTTPREIRDIRSFTLAIAPHQYQEVRQVIDEAVEKLSKIAKDNPLATTVYHIGLLAFPITHPIKTKREEDA